MMKRLFAVKNRDSGEFVEAVGFFGDKKVAKEQRNKLNQAAGVSHYCVTFGPDHHNYKGEK